MKVQYVVDPTAARLIALGVSPAAIEDAYTLAADVERRVAMQAWVQEFVDHGISSTINLPSWGTPGNDEDGVARFAAMLLRYLARLRGLTCYPDGARSGQPLVRVGYDEACRKIGMIADDVEDACSLSGRVGDCGS